MDKEPKTRTKKNDKAHRNFSYRGKYSPAHIRAQNAKLETTVKKVKKIKK
tara:strand:- start:3945 stop:4094 length:150 start_codon:yes stop_codon:yes gene_type:complete